MSDDQALLDLLAAPGRRPLRLHVTRVYGSAG